MGARALLAALGFLAAASAQAQDDLAMGRVQSPVLVIDADRLLAETAYGRRLGDDILRRGEALEVENDRIAAELTAEERSLTERRPTMEPEAFRAEADAFDARVQRIREEQDAKQQALEEAVAAGRAEFERLATPVLRDLMRDSGAAVIIEQREVLLSASAVDVTDEAIAAVDAAVGDGAGETPPGDVPDSGAGAAPSEETLPGPAAATADPAADPG